MPGYLSDNGLVLAEAVLDFFEQNPHEHIQSTWWCSTGCCFAGGLARAVGAQPLAIPIDSLGESEPAWTAAYVMTKAGERKAIKDFATEVLGLPEEDGRQIPSRLFHSCNTLEDLREMIADLAAGRWAH